MRTPEVKTNQPARRWLWAQSRPAWNWIILTLAAGLFSGLLLVAQARLLARVVHEAFMQTVPVGRMMPVYAMLLGLVLVRAGLVWCRQQAGFRAGAAVRGQIRKDMMAHLVACGPVAISRLQAGSLVSTVLDQVEAIHDFVAHYLPQMALAALLPLVILAFVFPISWAAGGILLVTAPLIPLFMILVGMGAESISQRHFQALARMSAHFLDVIRGLSTLKLFGRSKDQAQQVEHVSRQYRRQTMAVLRVAFLSSAVLEFFSAIAIALAAVYLGMYFLGYIEFGAYGKPISFASGFFILLLAPDFFLPLRELGSHYHARADAVGAAEEILKTLRQIQKDASPAQNVAIKAPRLIRFENVSLRYDQSRKRALCDLNLQIRRGERIAVVGQSGSGKSSLIHLLLGFTSPANGQILIDHIPMDPSSALALRHHCAWVGQTPMLFTGTIRENIHMACPGASHSRVEAAARMAGVAAFADQRPDGLDSLVGEQGLGLSAGQAQRVAIARALVRQAPILLLDEPTASLDKGTEAAIIADLQSWHIDCIMIIATHRAAALSLAERILVLREGELVAQGTLDELQQTRPDLLPRN